MNQRFIDVLPPHVPQETLDRIYLGEEATSRRRALVPARAAEPRLVARHPARSSVADAASGEGANERPRRLLPCLVPTRLLVRKAGERAARGCRVVWLSSVVRVSIRRWCRSWWQPACCGGGGGAGNDDFWSEESRKIDRRPPG